MDPTFQEILIFLMHLIF